MTLEEAIKTALEYEGKVHRVYLEALNADIGEEGKRVFRALCDEEKRHLEYLRSRLDEWQNRGELREEFLETAIPGRRAIDEGVSRLRKRLSGGRKTKHDIDLEMLQRALQVEEETSNFYQEMVRTLDETGRLLFQRFVEIEEGHKAIVQAEIDYLRGTGFWFDIQEFKMG